jgi:hypothetical protein
MPKHIFQSNGKAKNVNTTPSFESMMKSRVIIDIETAINQLDESKQKTYRHIANKKTRNILQATSTTNVLHKRQTHILKQLRNKLKLHNATTAHAKAKQSSL